MDTRLVIAVVGESGSGKNAFCGLVTELTGIERVISTTDRPMRPDETGSEYRFLTPARFDAIPNDARVAFGVFGGQRYCTQLSDFGRANLYLVEPDGFAELKRDPRFEIFGVRILVETRTRLSRTRDHRRLSRDDARYEIPMGEFDVVLDNNGTWDEFVEQVKASFIPKLRAAHPELFDEK